MSYLWPPADQQALLPLSQAFKFSFYTLHDKGARPSEGIQGACSALGPRKPSWGFRAAARGSLCIPVFI